MNRPLRYERICLVYQGGIANVFAVEDTKDGRHTIRLLQATFYECELFALGMGRAGCDVISLACNRAGDIINQPWDTDLDTAPWREAMHSVNM